mgnify:CR=1 FL=1
MTGNEPREPLAGLEDDVGFQVAFLEEDLLNRVAFRVLQYRKAGGLSQAGLAERMQTQQPAIARIAATGQMRKWRRARVDFSPFR